MPTVNFITECFFLTHILIWIMSEKIQKNYDSLGKELNKAIKEKDYQKYEQLMGQKLTLDVHLLNKNTLGGFRSLFTFTGAFIMTINS